MDYLNISKIYDLGSGMLIGVDQTNSNEDKTCLCIAKLENGAINIKDIKLIKKQEDIDKYINKNMAEIYEVFGISKID